MPLPPLCVIVGPTATGKTATSINVAKQVNGEIISADSMQIYRRMDIGAAKPSLEERQEIPHYMIDIIDPDEQYSVALFRKEAEKQILDIVSRSKIPVMVGGTGLYVRSVIDQYSFTQTGVDTELRTRLHKLAESDGVLAVHRLLEKVDSCTAARLHPNNIKRVIRAIEVYHNTGTPISKLHARDGQKTEKYRLFMFGLIMNRGDLYKRIEKRVEKMVADGLTNEVSKLLKDGYSSELTSMQGLGYKEIIPYLKGTTTLENAILTLKRNTRRYAKRQITWFRHDPRVNWIDTGCVSDPAAEIIKRLEGVY
ncbi:MAG TPA: tRNA (adenosine(37)-N6)-dimethylallyltransferase MiaA [Desulfotomaculum sp.]|nr:MAG: tRNA dimethylallyltransferase [Desulfotomaculum sp. 46_80]KUK85190.1 MAG: tRNA dimethylallyltransferase [Desulfofundulus kuznetsovii]HAG12209.1 tRNA (adenosine(37)-N6)-dimethylallyltransferase MiaA [Desulfotomaculum sp.]HBY04413.1 tRNA (adenosine(37)-N6)-dimethylallyltransferase MiaA [Desulfotomaculum sp.]